MGSKSDFNSAPGQGIDSTLNLSDSVNSASSQSGMRHLAQQNAVLSSNLRNLIETQNASNRMSQDNVSNNDNASTSSLQVILDSGVSRRSTEEKFRVLMAAVTGNIPQSNEAVVSEAQLEQLHERDRVAIKSYAEIEMASDSSAQTWKEKRIPRLIALSQYLGDTFKTSITDFTKVNDPILESKIARIPDALDNEFGFRQGIENELRCFFNWYNPLRHTFDATQASSGETSADPITTKDKQTEEQAAIPDDLKRILEARDEISNRTGISAENIEGVAFEAEVHGLRLFISKATATENNISEQDFFLRYARLPIIDANGYGMTFVHTEDTACAAIFNVNPGTGEIKDLDLMFEKPDAGGKHPDTMTIGQLARSLCNRHRPDWLRKAMNNIRQQTGVNVSDIAFVHYVTEDGVRPLFMTADTVKNIDCGLEALTSFFCYVWPTLYGDGRGDAHYIQNGEKHSVNFEFNTQTKEITSFRLSKPMDVDLTED